MKKRTVIGLVCGVIIIGVTTFVASNMFLKSKSNSTNQAKQKTVATVNNNDTEKAKLEKEKTKLQEEKDKLEEEKQKTENEKTEAENEKLKQENEKLKKTDNQDKNNSLTVTPEEYNGISEIVTNYVECFAEDVNEGQIDKTGPMYDNGPLFKQQEKTIPSLYSQGITEYVQNVHIQSIKRISGNVFKVATIETITVDKPSGSTTKDYHNIYTVKEYSDESEGTVYRMNNIE